MLTWGTTRYNNLFRVSEMSVNVSCFLQGFGDSKIVPDILPERLETIIQGSKAWAEDKTGMAELWSLVKEKVFSLDDRAKQLGLGSKGVTTYFTPNCSEQDAQKVTKFMNQANVEGYITRVIKKDKGGEDGRDLYEIRHAAVDSSVRGNRATFEGADFVITAGKFLTNFRKKIVMLKLCIFSGQATTANYC